MKLTALLLTLAFLQVHATGAAQHVTISGKDIPLKHVFNAIKQQTGFVVFYNKEVLSNTKPVSIAAYNMPLQQLLNFVFSNQPIGFIIQDKTIILTQKETANPPFERIIIDAPSVNGHVMDADDQPITNVSIRIRGTIRGTTSGADGAFALDVKPGEILDISAVGFSPIAIRLDGDRFTAVAPDKKESRNQSANAATGGSSHMLIAHKQNLALRLVRSNSLLDEVVIIPYGKTSKRFATGNITSIKSKDIERQPVMNVLQALEGKVPGMSITTLSGNSAAPLKVEIRGRSSLNAGALVEPLYIIDGIPLTNLEIGTYTKREVSTGAIQSGLVNTPGESPLLYLNPRDIESVDVLKDADATAIYGSRGANGVILITTKRAKAGPTRFNMAINNGILTTPKRARLLNTPDYLAVRREAYRNDGLTPDKYDAPDLTIWDPTKYTDWQRQLIGTGNTLTVNARISGGIAQTTYSISANYRNRKEIMNNGSRNIAGGFSLNINHTSLNRKFQVDAVSTLSLTNVNAYNVGDVTFLPPNAPDIYDANGDFNFVPWRGRYESNFKFNGLKIPSESKSTFITNSINVRYELVKSLTLSAMAGLNSTQNNNSYLVPQAASDPAFPRPSQASFGNSHNNNWTLEPQLQYATIFGKASLSIQAGATIQQANAKGITNIGIGFPNDNLMRSVNNAGMVMAVDSKGDYKYSAAYGIINLRWDNKYILNLSARRDGSSRFGPGRQFGNFGSAGFAWIASEEEWLKPILPAWVSFLKFRGSYGVTGKDGGTDYGYITRWASTYDLGFSQKLFDYNGTPGFHIAGSINPAFGWETTKKLEVAASLSLFKDKLNFDAAWYRNRSGNQLTAINTPSYTGFSNVTANWPAVVQNAGIELSLSGRVLQTKDWNIIVNANFSRNKNKLASYPGFEYSTYASTFVIGKPLTTMYLLHYTGIDPLTGSYTFEDRNKNGRINTGSGAVPQDDNDDRYIEFDRAVKFEGGFGASASYKNFGIYVNFIYKKQPAIDPFIDLAVGRMNNLVLPDEVRDHHWKQPGDKALYPRYTTNGNLGPIRDSDGAYIDGSYLRMNTLSLSYDLPSRWLQKIKMQGCRLSAETQNLFVITSYKGIDPEVQNLTGFTPISRVITTTLSFNF
ncbi:SusC/RagA family TonB-linked outer membrane protein [Pseudoflavitalea sp. G-6-1-2]|uniref:SusC/RagA family TonB-linked outer membrane protein n=1 Tax=Pseudoflavitalea sp. G-6-1-2 TaxID=2728841 RepID=UPI00146B0F8F|nr:SusC/RagA family TonB-linked outer membrane protein [Pseudoflavitalea sp. G-6-1-2]NML22390.1 SusC/RagA family TonB-linked outer membrane protein [Pseudoflavitalea sp. G-6-1-2]